LLRMPTQSDPFLDPCPRKNPHRGTALAQASPKRRSTRQQPRTPQPTHSSSSVSPTVWQEFCSEMVAPPFVEDFHRAVWQGDVAFAAPPLPQPEAPIRILRKGLPLATYRHQRLVPHHALARALTCGAAARHISLNPAETREYLHGNALTNRAQTANGIALLTCHDGLPLGFGKVTADRINNLYPKGLRTDHLE